MPDKRPLLIFILVDYHKCALAIFKSTYTVEVLHVNQV